MSVQPLYTCPKTKTAVNFENKLTAVLHLSNKTRYYVIQLFYRFSVAFEFAETAFRASVPYLAYDSAGDKDFSALFAL